MSACHITQGLTPSLLSLSCACKRYHIFSPLCMPSLLVSVVCLQQRRGRVDLIFYICDCFFLKVKECSENYVNQWKKKKLEGTLRLNCPDQDQQARESCETSSVHAAAPSTSNHPPPWHHPDLKWMTAPGFWAWFLTCEQIMKLIVPAQCNLAACACVYICDCVF